MLRIKYFDLSYNVLTDGLIWMRFTPIFIVQAPDKDDSYIPIRKKPIRTNEISLNEIIQIQNS